MRRFAFPLAALCAAMAVACAQETACRDWTSHVGELTEAERAQLDGYGARQGREGPLFSTRVVADCEPRGHFSRFVASVIRGSVADPEDADAVRDHQEQFVAALVAIWPTRNARFPGSDGAFRDELSSLLVIPEVGASNMRPLIAKVLKDDGVSSEVAYALLTRPDSFFLPNIRRLQAAPRSAQEEILALAVMQRLGDDTRPHLTRLDQRQDLSPQAKDVVRTLLDRYSKQSSPQWDDMIDVSL